MWVDLTNKEEKDINLRRQIKIKILIALGSGPEKSEYCSWYTHTYAGNYTRIKHVLNLEITFIILSRIVFGDVFQLRSNE